MDDIPRTFRYRFLEILPGVLSWSILILPMLASFWVPKAVAIFIILYVFLWFLRSLKSSAFLLYSYFKSKRLVKENWHHLLDFFSEHPPMASTKLERETVQKIQQLQQKGIFKKWTNIYHVVIMPTYKEEKEILESSLEAIAKTDFPRERIIIVLATEERDRMRAEINSAYLTQRFSYVFGQFYHVMHPAYLPNEIPAKGANISYAGQFIAKKLKDQGIDLSNVLVTTLDADNQPHCLYFSALTYHYLMEEEREKRSYQPLTFFNKNIWNVPFTNRLIALANTFWYLAESAQSNRLFNAATYAQSLKTLVAMDFWSCQTIVEDLHQFWRTYFHFHGNHKVVPLFIPVYQDALENRTYFTSLIGQYKQLRRWAWGASEIPYAILKMWKERKKLPLLRTIEKIVYLCYLEITWATAPIIILFNKSIPTIINPAFGRSLFAYNLGQIFTIVFTLMLSGILIYLFISLLCIPKPKGPSPWRFMLVFLEWTLLPLVTILYGAIPALDAQTRLMLNKPLSFNVTEKVRLGE